MRWLRRNAVVLAGLLALAYLLLPNLVVLAYSFNKPSGRFNYEWREFSTEAWQNPCGVAGMCGSLGLSLRIAAVATLAATAFGTLAAFALARYRFRGRGAVHGLIFLPMSMPEVVMAASLGTLFLNMRVEFGVTTILIAHIMFCLSFVIVAVKARVMSMDPRLEEASRDLYAGPAQTFFRVTLPLAAPGIAAGAMLSFALSIAAGAMLSFALSFDDFIITQFNAGPSTVTFPMFVWGAAQRGVPVQVNVIGSAMFVLAVAIVLAGRLLGARRNRAAA
ncbi:ABC transporter permease [Streptomyces sp. YIM 98790]|uniref:ABC transporter permease n=1 Tax=Streptomyces sp. YIM 98790 TaxID=2689077 RepID=UPI00140E31F6|nr:ABC transporter permease [Streptomyces sp. YIM 98790]